MLPIILVALGIVSRLIPHLWDFTPILAISLFAGAYLQKKYAFIVPLGLMIMTDIVLGFHNTILFTWGSILLTVTLGHSLREKKGFGRECFFGVLSAVLFFVVTNFGVWLMDYPKTWQGLAECYTLAVPFFRNSLVSTLIYTAVLFEGYAWVSVRIKSTKLYPNAEGF